MEDQPGDAMRNFRDAIDNPQTRAHYERHLKYFLEFVKMDADSLARKAKRDAVWCQREVMNFIRFQKTRVEADKIVSSSISNYFKPLKLFLEMNDVVLNWKKIKKTLPRMRKYAEDRAPTIDEIRLLISDGDMRLRCGVLVMCSSGIRVGAWDELKWKHVEPRYDDNKSVIAAKLTVYPLDSEKYFTLITPETYQALLEYIKFREMHGEKIGPNSPLLRDQFEATAKGSRGLAGRPKPLKSSGLKRLIERALWKHGIRKEKKKRHEFQTDHGFRKFFKTQAERAMKSLHVELLMGHSTGLGDNYYRESEDGILESYLKAVPFLTISPEPSQTNQKSDERMEKLEAGMEFFRDRYYELSDTINRMMQGAREGRLSIEGSDREQIKLVPRRTRKISRR